MNAVKTLTITVHYDGQNPAAREHLGRLLTEIGYTVDTLNEETEARFGNDVHGNQLVVDWDYRYEAD